MGRGRLNHSALDVRSLRCGGRRARQRGFNFAEVLFAVMILGIGFIMVAAIFPVALMQTKTTQEETTGASIARGGANYLEQVAADATMPGTNGAVISLDRVAAVRGMMALSADSRYAWVPFYRRTGPADATASPFAQIYMIPVATRNRPIYDKGVPPVVQNLTNGAAILMANIVDSTENGLSVNPDGIDYIEFIE